MSLFIRKLLTTQRLLCGIGVVLCIAGVSSNAAYASDSYAIKSIEDQEKHQVTGVVSDENGNPMPGVVVSILETTTGDVTKANGEYSINIATGETLQYSFIGYKTQKIKVGTESVLNVKLKVEGITGDEVVVVGFGTIKKSSLTGSISVVKADQLAERPVQNIGQALQGMVPGLNLTVGGNGGELNNTMSMNIRGAGTLGTGSESAPLVLIDGMEGDMNTINMQDVESISVMKDAASATIYGSRAPFGVILITTKKGRQGKATVNYNNSFRFTNPIGLPEVVDSWRFANYTNEGSANGGETNFYDEVTMQNIPRYMSGEIDYNTEPEPGNPDQWKTWKAWANTDWFDIYYKDWAFTQEHTASVSGGSEKVQYYISANYLDQEGSLNYSEDAYNRYSFSSKIDAEIAPWVKIGVSTRFIRTNYERATYQNELLYHEILKTKPTVPLTYPKLNPMPTENYVGRSDIGSLMYGGRTYNNKDQLYQQANITIEPIKNWTIVGELNYRIDIHKDTENHLPWSYQTPLGNIKDAGWVMPGKSRVKSTRKTTNYINPSISTNYEKEWDSGHYFKATAGFISETNNNEWISGTGDELLTMDIPTLSNSTLFQIAEGTASDWATVGVFARLNYTYKDKYLLEVSARYDGSSRFLDDQRWNLFPSVSAGWNLKNEDFLKDVRNIDIIKVRASWGQLGNQNTKNVYPFYQSINVKKVYNGWLTDGAESPLYIENAPGLVSSLLTWETVEDWNIGVDFGFLSNRLTGSFDIFNRKTLNMIGPAPTLPGVLGIAVPKINNADLVNKGWEFAISWRDLVSSIGLSYGISANISDSKQKVTRYPNPTGAINNNIYNAGQYTGNIWGYTTIGIAQSDEEMSAHLATTSQSFNSTWGAGDIMYADLNGDGIVNGGANTLEDPGDRTIIGNTTPRYTYGATADVAWNGFDFSIYIQGVGKRDYFAGAAAFWGLSGGGSGTVLEQHLDYWRPADTESIFGPNTDGYYAKPYFNSGKASKNQQTQTKYLQDASYVRIKNIQLGYTLPSRISNKLAMKNIRVFVSADNLFVFTPLSDIFDPEAVLNTSYGTGKVYPMSRVVSFGVNVTL